MVKIEVLGKGLGCLDKSTWVKRWFYDRYDG